MIGHKPGIIFMGTPSFAVPSLEILIEKGYPLLAVVTTPDKPSGRGLKVAGSEVKKAALARNIPVLQPSNLKDDHFAESLRAYQAGLFVVVAFRMLPKKIWSIPPMGTINLHASLLPLYRGAAPINHAIINGEKITGVTTFLIEKDIDTGNVLLQESTAIGDDETAGQLHNRLMKIGARLLLETVDGMTAGTINPVPQHTLGAGADLPVAPKLTRSDCRISWDQSAARIHDFVRGLSPYPGAWTVVDMRGRKSHLKIFSTEALSAEHSHKPGEMLQIDQTLAVAAGDGIIIVKCLQPEGRRRMAADEFIKGFRPEGPVQFV